MLPSFLTAFCALAEKKRLISNSIICLPPLTASTLIFCSSYHQSHQSSPPSGGDPSLITSSFLALPKLYFVVFSPFRETEDRLHSLLIVQKKLDIYAK